MSFLGNRPMQYPQPLGMQDQQVSNNQLGTPVAYVAGTRRLSATWISPIYNLKAYSSGGGKKGQGGKGKSGGGGPQTYNYFGTVAGGICAGPIDCICGIIMDGELVWPQCNGWSVGQMIMAGDIYCYDAQAWIAQEDMTSSSGNAPGMLDGDNNPYWLEFTYGPDATGGAATAAWTAGQEYQVDALVAFDGNIYICTNNNTAVSGTSPGNAPPDPTYWAASTSRSGAVWTPGHTYYAGQTVQYGVRYYKCVLVNVAVGAGSGGNEPGSGGGCWDLYSVAGTNFDDITIVIPNTGSTAKKNSVGMPTVYGVLRLYWGNQTTPDPVLSSDGNDQLTQHPAYVGMFYVVLGPISADGTPGFFLGQGNNTAPNLEIIVRRTPAQSVIDEDTSIVDGNTNPAVAIADLLTNPNALGLESSLVDSTSFDATAALYATNPQYYYLSPLIDTQEQINSILDRVITATDCWFYFNPSTQKVTMGLYQHGVTPESYATLNQYSLTERPKLKGEGWSKAMSRVTGSFSDRVLCFSSNSLKSDDPRAFNVLGQVRNSNVDLPWVTRASQALFLTQEILRTVGVPQLTAEITVRREWARTITPGSYVLLDIDLEPNSFTIEAFFRVKEKITPQRGGIKLRLVKDPTLNPIPIKNAPPALLPYSTSLTPISDLRIVCDDYGITSESPALKLASLESLTTDTTVIGAETVIVLAERPDTFAIGCEVWFDTNDTTGTFPSLGVQGGWAAKAILTREVANTDSFIECQFNPNAIDQSLYGISPGVAGTSGDQLLAILVGISDGEVALDLAGRGLVEVWEVETQELDNNETASSYSVYTASGSTLVLTVASTSGFVVGQWVELDLVDDLLGANGLRQITAINTGAETITVTFAQSTGDISEAQSGTVTGYYYTLTGPRGQYTTWPQDWALATTEVWLVWRSQLASLKSPQFPVIRGNALSSTSPDSGYFIVTPFSKRYEYPKYDVTPVAFSFPTKAPEGPRLRISLPTSGQIDVYADTSGGNFLSAQKPAFEIIITGTDLNVGYFAWWLIPQGTSPDPNNPTAAYNIQTGAYVTNGYDGTAIAGGLQTVHLELNRSLGGTAIVSGTAASDSGYFNSTIGGFTLTGCSITKPGLYRLIAMAQDIAGLNGAGMAEITINAQSSN